LLPVSILSLLIQAALIVHVIRTGRNTLWILAIGFLPGIGSLAYVVAEVYRTCCAAALRAGLKRVSAA
jgi:hypothetical protein